MVLSSEDVSEANEAAVGRVGSRTQPDNLPLGLTSFVGRRQEVAAVRRLLSSSHLVTLTGAGGVGKSRLALTVASQVQRLFADGVWLVELSALAEPSLVGQAVLEALRVRSLSPGRRPVDRLTEFLQDKKTLVVLDNCEHLVRECAGFAEALLRRVPGLRILATSREPLRIAGEHTFTVPPLSVPAPSRPLSHTDSQSESMVLFTDRARAVLPDFSITDDNQELLAQVCQRLDGVPLAIELAAGRVRTLSLEQILARLDDQHDLLSQGERTAPPRHYTLRQAMAWSFDLCSPEERLLWSRLSIFAGGFDLDAVEGTCSDRQLAQPAVFPTLAALVDKSIVVREKGSGRARYRLLEPVRQYGRDQLAAYGEEAVLRARHRDYYLGLAEQAELEWFGPAQGAWSAYVRDALANIRVALDFCLTETGHARMGLCMAGALWFYWVACDYPAEGRHWLERALTLDTEGSRERARALWACGYVALREGQFAAALAKLDEGHRLAEELGDQQALAAAFEISGLVEILRNNLSQAVPLLQRAVEMYESEKASTALAPLALAHLALAATLSGDVDRAVSLCERARVICAEQDERWALSYALWNLGLAHWRGSDLVAATAAARDALKAKHELNDLFGIALGIELLAWIAAANGEAERAACLLGASQKSWQPIGKLLYGSETYLSFHDDCMRLARRALGEKAYQRVAARGEKLSLEELIAYACAEASEPPPATAPVDHLPTLTRRERQVAELVGQGQSNKQIADILVISQRTAETHVEHILIKLGFTSRAQIATWVAQQEIPQPSGR